MLLARGGPGDPERARDLLAEAVASYRELGMESWAEAAAPPPPLTRGRVMRSFAGPHADR